ncbi:uncharacterized protein LOC115242804 [Formica exsecta]|uniref:uncharacterized protein LOC115242804 n=1 Tax=Formica exsecta TaxID=72781 RepID=UPI001142A2A6|nr:uncharacterized protein LOC115242804 [Formica exsecta]
MDDVLTGAPTIAEAKEMQQQLTLICRAGGFPLKKWSANSSALLADLPAEDLLQRDPRWWQPGKSHSTLGLRWHPHEDSFAFSIPPLQLSTVTKRTVLSLTARLFDPMGWLAPTTVRAKIIIQATWLLRVDWDTPLPEGDVQRWQEFQTELPFLEHIRVPRGLTGGTAYRREIHGFADASEKAYAAVAYLRTENLEGEVEVTLLSAKTKVAPLKQVILPRLELYAATLLIRLVGHIGRVLETSDVTIHLWSDSTVALGWIRGHPAGWKTYVANRVSEIQTSLPDAVWHHIPGRDNPADCASRGLSPKELVNHPLWWHGPTWLSTETGDWTTAGDCDGESELPEQRASSHAATSIKEKSQEPEMLNLYLALPRLLRVMAWCRRWLGRPLERLVPEVRANPAVQRVLRASEVEEARLSWIRVMQAANFKEVLAAIANGKSLPTRSTLTRLTPFRDPQGILRVGCRIKRALLSYDARHPIILPGGSTFTRLVIKAYHRRTLHGSVQLTLGSIRQEYWILRGRALVKSSIHRCLMCLRWRAATPQPLMGDLPRPRVTPARPFLHTGVDYARPMWLRTSGGRGQRATKAFLVVFVCHSTRAVHLDIASDYSADAFLTALRRLIARRGLCRAVYSDCGTNFVDVDARQLRALFAASGQEG